MRSALSTCTQSCDEKKDDETRDLGERKVNHLVPRGSSIERDVWSESSRSRKEAYCSQANSVRTKEPAKHATREQLAPPPREKVRGL